MDTRDRKIRRKIITPLNIRFFLNEHSELESTFFEDVIMIGVDIEKAVSTRFSSCILYGNSFKLLDKVTVSQSTLRNNKIQEIRHSSFSLSVISECFCKLLHFTTFTDTILAYFQVTNDTLFQELIFENSSWVWAGDENHVKPTVVETWVGEEDEPCNSWKDLLNLTGFEEEI